MERAGKRSEVQERRAVLPQAQRTSAGRAGRNRYAGSFAAGVGLIAALMGGLAYWNLRKEQRDNAMLAALRRKQTDRVMRLLTQGADPNARERPYVRRSLWEHITGLFDRLSDQAVGQRTEASALALAVEQGDTQSTRALIARGARDADPQVIDLGYFGDGSPRPLILIAVHQGNREIVQALLDQGAKLESRDGYGWTALMVGIDGLHKSLANNGLSGPERQAVLQKYRGVLRLALDRGVPLEEGDEEGETALRHAVQANEPEIVADLLARHADPNHPDSMGKWTPFSAAVHRNDIPMVEAMSAKGARVNPVVGEPPLLIALEPDKSDTSAPDPALLRLLLARGADVHARKRSGSDDEHSNWTALLLAAGLVGRAHQEQALQLLLAHGADIEEHTSPDQRTALMMVAQRGAVPALRLLLDHGARIEACDHTGNTALHYAVQEKNAATIRLLLQRGANINAYNAQGHTPLDFASGTHDRAIIALLNRPSARP